MVSPRCRNYGIPYIRCSVSVAYMPLFVSGECEACSTRALLWKGVLWSAIHFVDAQYQRVFCCGAAFILGLFDRPALLFPQVSLLSRTKGLIT